MFKFKLSVLIFIVSILIMVTKSQDSIRGSNGIKKLKVTILYESLCPDSRRFMIMLEQVYSQLGQYLDINLVPFGKSNSQFNGAQFTCQHGPNECEGNRKQSCVLNQLSNQDSQVDFAVCQMKAWDATNIDACANAVGLTNSIADIEKCIETEEGTKLQLEAERITNKYEPTFVPTIIYNDEFNQILQDKSIQNFHRTVCNLLMRLNRLEPNECQF